MDSKALKVVGTAVAAYAGYEIYQLSQLSKSFSYRIVGFSIHKGSASTLNISFNVAFNNTSQVSVPLSSVSGSIYTKGDNPKLICRFSTEKAVLLEAGKETVFPIAAKVTGISFIGAMAQLVDDKNSVVQVHYKTVVKPTLAFFIPVPVSTTKIQDVDIKQSIPSIQSTFKSMQPYLKELGGNLVKLTDAGLTLIDAINQIKKA